MNEQYFTSLNGYYVKDKEAIHTYDSVAEMKSDSKIREGSYVKTKGYYNTNDGGNGEYIIRTKNQNDVEDNGSIHFIQNNLVAELVIEDNINIKQFGAKGDGVNDDSSKIQNAINYLRNKAINIGDINGISTLLFNEGNYRINNQIILSPLVKLKSIGMCVFSSYVTNDSTFWLKPQNTDFTDGELSTVRDWYQGNYIDGSSGFVINSEVTTSETSNIGLEIGLKEQLDSEKGFMFGKIFGVSINNFNIGLKINPINVYCDTFEKLTLSSNIQQDNIALQFGDSNITRVTNSGERVSFVDCQIGQISFYCPFDINFIRCSFDFTNYVFYSPNNSGYCRITCDACWFEGMSYLVTDEDIEDSKPYGIISQQFNYSVFKIVNSNFVLTNMRKLFDCPSETSISYQLILENINITNASINDDDSQIYNPKNTYFCDDKVHVSARNVINYLNKKGNFVSRRLNCFNNPNFDTATLGDFSLSTGGTISSYTMVGFTGFNLIGSIINNEINEKKSIQLTSSTTTSAMRLKSEKIKVSEGETLQANAWFYGFSSFGVTFLYYDNENNLISSSDGIINNPTHNIDMYYLNPYNKIETVPARTKFVEVEYRFNIDNGTPGSNSIIGELLLQKY